MKFGQQMKGRRQSSNIEDLRGRNRQVNTTKKTDRLHPMGAPFVSGMSKIERVQKYAKQRGRAIEIDNFMKGQAIEKLRKWSNTRKK